MYCVYMLKSRKDPSKNYIGITKNVEKRLKEHNSRLSTYSKSFAPWELETYIVFNNRLLAERFEKHLKGGSGHAFLKKRLVAEAMQ